MRRLIAWAKRKWPLVWKSTHQETVTSLGEAMQTIRAFAIELDAAMQVQIQPLVKATLDLEEPPSSVRARPFYDAYHRETGAVVRVEVIRELAFRINRDEEAVTNVTHSHAIFRKHAYGAVRKLWEEVAHEAAVQLSNHLLEQRIAAASNKGRQNGAEEAGRSALSERRLEKDGPAGIGDLSAPETVKRRRARSGGGKKARSRPSARK